MGVVLLQILQWILRIILFLLIFLLVLVAIILIVPIRYRAEWDFLEKKPGVRGKITWFFYLIYMRFYYEEDFRIQVRVCGFKVFDSGEEEKSSKNKKKKNKDEKNEIEKNEVQETESRNLEIEKETEEVKKEEVKEEKIKEEVEPEKTVVEDNSKDSVSEKDKKSLSEKIENIKSKIQDLIQKIKDIIDKIQDGKLKAEHYLELWNRKETQITFGRAKTKLGRMVKAILPGKWQVTGEIGMKDPCTTGQLMGALGAMYPILGNKVQIVPNFEEQIIDIEGNVKGHIRLGNLLYQLVSLLLNRHCFKFIKMIFDELGSEKKSKKEI